MMQPELWFWLLVTGHITKSGLKTAFLVQAVRGQADTRKKRLWLKPWPDGRCSCYWYGSDPANTVSTSLLLLL